MGIFGMGTFTAVNIDLTSIKAFDVAGRLVLLQKR